MASKKGDCAGSGSGARNVGKAGKVRVDGRQCRLSTEEKDGGKRVTFKLEERKEEAVEQEEGAVGLTDMKGMIKQMVRREIKDILKEQEDKVRKEIEDLKVSVKRVEEKLEVLSREDKEWEERWEEFRVGFESLGKKLQERIDKRIKERCRLRIREEEGESSEVRIREGTDSESEREGTWSRGGSRIFGSSGTVWSEDRLSSREVDKIRKWVNEKERSERKSNIVLRGVEMPSGIEKDKERGREWIQDLIKSKLGVECEINEVRKSGPVIVAKIKGEEGKREIMKNK